MKIAKIIWGASTIFFILIGVYLQITDGVVKGEYVSRYGQWQHSTLSAKALYLFAAIYLVVWIFWVRADQKDRKKIK